MDTAVSAQSRTPANEYNRQVKQRLRETRRGTSNATVFGVSLRLCFQDVALDLRWRQGLSGALRRKLQLVVDECVDVLMRLRAR